MKELILALVTKSPLIRPISAPARIASGTESS